MDLLQDTTSRYFQSHVSMPDGTFSSPLTQIEFTFGRSTMMDNSAINPTPHPLASPDTLIMDELTFKSTSEALTNKGITDFFKYRKLSKASKWSQISMLMTSKLRTTGVLSIVKHISGIPICGPPTLRPIDNNLISIIDFTQIDRDTESQQFHSQLNYWNRINNMVSDLLISSIDSDAVSSNSLFPILVTNHLLDSNNNSPVLASRIFEVISKYFIEKMGNCDQIRSKCLTISTQLRRDSSVNLFDSELQFLFSDFKFRHPNKESLDEPSKISYLVSAFNVHPDHRMRMCATDLSLKLRLETDLTYEKAVIILTHVESDILALELNATLASTISSQYRRQSDLFLANSMDHEERISIVQNNTRKRRTRQPSRLETYQQQRIYEDPNPPARMNRYGYDGPNRHQFGGNKVPIPAGYFNPQHERRYPVIEMQSAPEPPRSPQPQRFSSQHGQNNNTSLSQNQNQSNTNTYPSRSRSNSDPQINVTFSPDTYTPHSSSSNNQHPRNTLGRGRNNGRQGRGHGRSRSVTSARGNSESRWTRDGQNMIEDPLTPVSTASTDNSTVPMIPDDDQPIIAVSTEEEKYLICDSAASRNNISLGSTDVQDYRTSDESLLTARIGSSLTVIGNGTIGLLGEVKVIPANQLSKNIMSCGVMSRRGFSFSSEHTEGTV